MSVVDNNGTTTIDNGTTASTDGTGLLGIQLLNNVVVTGTGTKLVDDGVLNLGAGVNAISNILVENGATLEDNNAVRVTAIDNITIGQGGTFQQDVIGVPAVGALTNSEIPLFATNETSGTYRLTTTGAGGLVGGVGNIQFGDTIDLPANVDHVAYVPPQPGIAGIASFPAEFKLFDSSNNLVGTLDLGNPGSIASVLGVNIGADQTNYVAADFVTTRLPDGELQVVYEKPCYAAGTRIATTRGEVAIEDLTVGDMVLTVRADGAAPRPVRWIGERRVNIAGHPKPDFVRPIRILAGAFGQNLPRRDLWVSPDHSVFVNGVLIPAKWLVNGATITQERVDSIHYFHVELDAHDVILAEGLPAESYLDTGNRAQFANGAAFMALHPDFQALTWDNACAPLCVSGAAVMTVKQQLRARAEEVFGFRLVKEPAIRILAGSAEMRPASVEGNLQTYLLPAGTSEVVVCSAAGVPAGTYLASNDLRRLGVRILGAMVNGQALPLPHEAYGSGFHAVESDESLSWRWTDGAAHLRLPETAAEQAVLELLVLEAMPIWMRPIEAGEKAAA